MEHTIYINTTDRRATAVQDGVTALALTARLQSHLKLTVYFHAADTAPALLSGATFRVVLKDAATPSASVLALLSAATDTGADYYEFEWSQIDSSAMRTLIGDLESVPVVLEVEWTLSGKVERVAIPVTLSNAWLRSGDAAPDFEPFAASITAGGYLRLVNSDGDVFHIGLNTGEPPG